ncbi:GNAT family N-acetyltransferase [Hyphomonas johnsonii]|uniref:Putative acetyltransferase n=1 Tax=Hyphomonas johnsonii MHS-2 TaxID=1280950 RepID=A0A059FSW6_9PROT|nr:GNAT family N-acetyltransferase [Hyphomonas johnsonii]KCZ93712.1 putative acetyltransferase [Hyphomonas johnsonii MHS-2]
MPPADTGLTVRSASQADLPVLKAFEQGIITAERPYDHTLKPDPISYYDLGALIDSDDAEVAVVEAGGVIIASGYAHKRSARDYLKHMHFAFLGFMYVVPEHRGQGINKRLLDHLFDWARAKGLPEIQLTVYSENTPAIRAYEKAGFASHITEMRFNLDE